MLTFYTGVEHKTRRFIDVYSSKVEERMSVSLCLSLAVLLSVSSLTCLMTRVALNMDTMAGWVILEKTG